MENPESRPPAAKLIDEVIRNHYSYPKLVEEVQCGTKVKEAEICGWSLCMKIYDALVQEGHLPKG